MTEENFNTAIANIVDTIMKREYMLDLIETNNLTEEEVNDIRFAIEEAIECSQQIADK